MAQVATTYPYAAAVAQPAIGTTATGQTPAASVYAATQIQANAATASATAAQHTAYQQMLEAYQRQQQQQSAAGAANPAVATGANAAGGIMYAAHPVQYDPSALYQQQQQQATAAGTLAYQAAAAYQPAAAGAPQQANAAAAAAAAVASYQQQLAAYQQQQQQVAYQQQQLQQQQAATYQQQAVATAAAYQQSQQVSYQQQATLAYQQPQQSVASSQAAFPPQYGAAATQSVASSYYGALPQQQAAPVPASAPTVPLAQSYQDPYSAGSSVYQQPQYDMAPRPQQYDGASSLMGAATPMHGAYGSPMQHRPSFQGYSRGPRPSGGPGGMGYGPRPQRVGYTPRAQSTNQTPFLSFYEGDDNDTVPNIIFISELPQSISNELLAQEFSSCGPIATLDEKGERPKVWIYKDRATRVPRGDATITFQDEESAKKAVEKYNDKELFGKTIKVSLVTIKQMNHQIQIRLQIAQNPRNQNNYGGSGGGSYDQQSSGGGGAYSSPMGIRQMDPSATSAMRGGQAGGFYRDSVNGAGMSPYRGGQAPNGRGGRGGGYTRGGYGRGAGSATTGPSRYASQGSPRRSRGRPGPY